MNDRTFDELFARYPARMQPLSPIMSLGGGGGSSGARLWRFHAGDGELLLRVWPLESPGRGHIEQVHRWLSLAAELGFIPVPIRDHAGESVQEWHGGFWEITPWLVGSADPTRPPGLERVRLAFTGLGTFHQRLAGEQVEAHSAGLRQRHDEIIRLIGGGFYTLETAIKRHRQCGARYQDKALGWLALARDMAPVLLDPLARVSSRVVRVQPAIRDARPEHFLFEENRLSGLVDFGAMGVESVAADLAQLIGEWFDGDQGIRREALASYERIRSLDPDESQLIAIFEATTALLIGERWVRWFYVENRRFDDPQAVWRGLDRGLTRLNRLARELAVSRLSF